MTDERNPMPDLPRLHSHCEPIELTVTALGLSLTVYVRGRGLRAGRTWRDMDKAPRVYVDLSDDAEAAKRLVPAPSVELFPHLYDALPRVYETKDDGSWAPGERRTIHTHRGDFPEVDKAFDAWNREYVKIAKAVVAAALEAIGLNYESLRWSAKAGCSCPCSPGFVTKGAPGAGYDVWVSAKTLEETYDPEVISPDAVVSTEERTEELADA